MTSYASNPDGFPRRLKEGAGISITENNLDIAFTFTGTAGSGLPAMHALDPSGGYHTGVLQAQFGGTNFINPTGTYIKFQAPSGGIQFQVQDAVGSDWSFVLNSNVAFKTNPAGTSFFITANHDGSTVNSFVPTGTDLTPIHFAMMQNVNRFTVPQYFNDKIAVDEKVSVGRGASIFADVDFEVFPNGYVPRNWTLATPDIGIIHGITGTATSISLIGSRGNLVQRYSFSTEFDRERGAIAYIPITGLIGYVSGTARMIINESGNINLYPHVRGSADFPAWTLTNTGVLHYSGGANASYSLSATGTGQNVVYNFYDKLGTDLKARLIYAGVNAPGGRYIGLVNDNADYMAFYTSGFTRGYFMNGVGDVFPVTAGLQNLGNATNYWNDVSYKTLTDRGCLGFFDDGVELRDGTIVTDVEAIKRIRKHPTKKTIYGVPMLDYETMPKVVFKEAPIAEVDTHLKDGRIIPKGAKIGEDGAETTAIISILIGSIKELSARIDTLEGKK